jgi:hypothetical protein
MMYAEMFLAECIENFHQNLLHMFEAEAFSRPSRIHFFRFQEWVLMCGYG